jgi:hypothetical protein
MAGFYTIKQDGKTSLGATSQNGNILYNNVSCHGNMLYGASARNYMKWRHATKLDATAGQDAVQLYDTGHRGRTG